MNVQSPIGIAGPVGAAFTHPTPRSLAVRRVRLCRR
jgi:hypothetical protein